jgi:hypothetical protein
MMTTRRFYSTGGKAFLLRSGAMHRGPTGRGSKGPDAGGDEPAVVATRRHQTAWFAVVVWMTAIAWGSLTPRVSAPSVPDVALHWGVYLVLVWLLRIALALDGVDRRLLAGVLAVGFGAFIEGIQAMLPYRGAEVRDLLANAIGVAIGMLLPIRWSLRRSQRSPR